MKKIALLALLAVGAGAQAVLLDGFVDGSYNSGYLTNVGDSAINWSAATVVGGIRATYISVLANDDAEDARLRVRGLVENGSYSVSAGPGVSVFAQLGYGYDFNNNIGGNDLNLDLTATNQIRLGFHVNDLDLDTTVILVSNGAVIGAQNKVIAGGQEHFSEVFTFGGGGLADVDQILVNFYNTPSGDWSLKNVEAVPEPASMAILGLGLAAFAKRRNR